MGRKVIFTEEQLKHIAEVSGANGDEIVEATCCSGVGIQGNHGEPIVKGSGFDMKDDKFWGDSLNHQKAGFERVGDKK